MPTEVAGKISRISVNHVTSSVSFMLEGDDRRYLLHVPGAEYMQKDSAQAFDLTHAGDLVEIAFYERKSAKKDGDVSSWKNLTLDLQGGYPDML